MLRLTRENVASGFDTSESISGISICLQNISKGLDFEEHFFLNCLGTFVVNISQHSQAFLAASCAHVLRRKVTYRVCQDFFYLNSHK